MSSIVLLAMSLYLADFRLAVVPVVNFARLLGSSYFLCILSVFSRWSDRDEMQI